MTSNTKWRLYTLFGGHRACRVSGIIVLILLYLFALSSSPWRPYPSQKVPSTLASVKAVTFVEPQPKLSPRPSVNTTDHIPKKIWYKLGVMGLSGENRQWTDTCIQQNPGHEHKFFDDAEADAFIKEKYAVWPELVETFLALQVPIWKADLFRYLLLYIEGGIYSDLDVECLGTPMDDWIPLHFRAASPGLVVGLEFDINIREQNDWPRQFETWTFLAKPGVPHIWQVIEDIMSEIQQAIARHNLAAVSDLRLDMDGLTADVIQFTGPIRFTKGVIKSLQRQLNAKVYGPSMKNLVEPKMLGDVLILPGQSFAHTQNRYPEEVWTKLPPALVRHHYAGSWKNHRGGEGKGEGAGNSWFPFS